MRVNRNLFCATFLLLLSAEVSLVQATDDFKLEFASYPTKVILRHELDDMNVRLHATWSYHNVGQMLDRLEGRALTSAGNVRYAFSSQRCFNFGVYCKMLIAHGVTSTDIEYSSNLVFLDPISYYGAWLGSHDTSPPVKLVLSVEMFLLDDGGHQIENKTATVSIPVASPSVTLTDYVTYTLPQGTTTATHTFIQEAGFPRGQILGLLVGAFAIGVAVVYLLVKNQHAKKKQTGN